MAKQAFQVTEQNAPCFISNYQYRVQNFQTCLNNQIHVIQDDSRQLIYIQCSSYQVKRFKSDKITWRDLIPKQGPTQQFEPFTEGEEEIVAAKIQHLDKKTNPYYLTQKEIYAAQVYWFIAISVCLTSYLVVYFAFQKVDQNLNNKMVESDASVGKAMVGGPFTLTDHNGRKFSREKLKGQFSLLYFGFTHCPDICPDEMTKIVDAMTILESKGIEITPVFITVDPQRDKVPQVKKYVKEYHPRMIGLTGKQDDIEKMCKVYRVYFMPTNDNPDDYLIDHSIIMYLLNPEAEFVTFYGRNYDKTTLYQSIHNYVAKWEQEHPEYKRKQ